MSSISNHASNENYACDLWTTLVKCLNARKSSSVLFFCCLWVGMSSILDAYLAYYYRRVIFFTEENPVCLWLMRLEPEHLSFFLIAKLVSTVLVLLVLRQVYLVRNSVGIPVALGISFFQFALLGYQFLA